MKQKPLILLDLEQTVIGDWWEDRFVHFPSCEKIKTIISERKIEDFSLGLFSWAVWNDEDKKIFKDELQEPLEKFFNKPFEMAWSLKDWSEQILKNVGKRTSQDDFFDLLGKHEVLMLARKMPILQRNILFFDDIAHHGLKMTTPQGFQLECFNMHNI